MKRGKVALAMSGGIDSSVSAYLLKKSGFSVTGFFIKFWSDPFCLIPGNLEQKKENSCCNDRSMRNAQNIAFQLNIPFYVLDAKKLFKKTVVDNFINEFKKYKTPNPCVKCNQFIKFGWFLDFTIALGFDSVATGHYCRIKRERNGVYNLLKGVDETKDQSYFLYRLKQNQLARIIFPVGKLTKKEVWKIANNNKIRIYGAKESQEICFIHDRDYRDFLMSYLPKKYFKPGNIINISGKIIGRHTGLLNYTVGQRKGIEIKEIKNENKKPLYVMKLKKNSNELVVGEDKKIYGKRMALKNITWTSDWSQKEALGNKKLKVGIRYHHKTTPCEIKKLDKNKIKVEFNKPQRAITPGQSAVFYKGDIILGGGEID